MHTPPARGDRPSHRSYRSYRSYRSHRAVGVVTLVLVAGLLLVVASSEVPGSGPDTAAAPAAAAGVPGPPGGEATVGLEGSEPWWPVWSSGPAQVSVPGREVTAVDRAASRRPVGADAPGASASRDEPQEAAGPPAPRPDDHLAVIVTAGQQERYDPGPPAEPAPALRTEEGFDVVAGSAVRGSGPEVTYTVELEPGVEEDLLALAAVVEEALGDPRSWARDHTLRRVEDPADADIRVVLASPSVVDRLCGQVGLRTLGRYSCWNGTFAALNAWRWAAGADGFDDLTTYRRYLVNHEFGHGLGYGHVGCPAAGVPAPVMMQQSMGTGACTANGWPYPEAPVE